MTLQLPVLPNADDFDHKPTNPLTPNAGLCRHLKLPQNEVIEMVSQVLRLAWNEDDLSDGGLLMDMVHLGPPEGCFTFVSPLLIYR